MADSDSIDLHWGLRFCISDKLSVDIHTTGHRIRIWVAKSQTVFSTLENIKFAVVACKALKKDQPPSDFKK